MKHCAAISDDPEAIGVLHGLTKERLRSLGVVWRPAKKQKSAFPVTPGGGAKKSLNKKCAEKHVVFGRPLRDLAPASVVLEASDVVVPHFLVAVLDFLRKEAEIEGLFRKVGSAQRQKILRAQVEEAETFYVANGTQVSPLDVASLLKQWLRELPEPLIPSRFDDIFISCAKLKGDVETKAEALLSCCLLLPPLHVASLSLLMRFLAEVASKSEANKMDSRNLAIVFTPGLFPVSDDLATYAKTSSDLSVKSDIVEMLINNANRIGMLNKGLEEAISIPVPSQSEDDCLAPSEGDEDEGGRDGPSARRRKKKKHRRSGSLSRVLTATMKGIHKAISRSTTPMGPPRDTFPTFAMTPYNNSATHSPDHRSSAFGSPRLGGSKRKHAMDTCDLSPSSKFRKATLEATPRVTRTRSISLKNRFKRKKSLTSGAVVNFKEPSLVVHFDGNTAAAASCSGTPLPSKPTLAHLMATPGTPAGLDGDMPGNGQDLSVGNLKDGEDTVDFHKAFEEHRKPPGSASTSSSSVATTVSISSTGSAGSRKAKRRSSERKPRSPSERKIGIVRRRSQEMARKAAKANNSGGLKVPKATYNNLPVLDESYLRSQLRRGKPNTFRIKPSPMKVEQSEGKTRIKISFREGQIEEPKVLKKASGEHNSSSRGVNESLTNLRQDISSIIEQSFGPTSSADEIFGSSLHQLSLKDKSSVNDITDGLEAFNMPDLPTSLTTPAVTTRGMLRRQSSAFEFSRPPPTNAKLEIPVVTKHMVRRQSSAFELAAKAKPSDFNRGAATRASLRQRNSSVKDLVKKLEGGTSDLPKATSAAASSSFVFATPQAKSPVKAKKAPSPFSKAELAEGDDAFPADEWMDASEFFNDKRPMKASSHHAAFVMDETSGCKRSSIIRIRTERKGLVSKSVETFTKPPPMPATPLSARKGRTPAKTPLSAQPSRRMSARMGIAGKATPKGSTGVSVAPAVTIAPRRQTLTGIRTCANKEAKRASVEPTYSNIEATKRPEALYENVKPALPPRQPTPKRTPTRPASSLQTPKAGQRRSKRLEGRRHLTIGYEGEVRSPLKERQNTPLMAKVQRSKSAQNPPRKHQNQIKSKNSGGRKMDENGLDFFLANVQRSKSLRSPGASIKVPQSLKETIYDVTTPKSEKVRRNLSDRVMTPRRGKQAAVPFIKTALNTSRTPHRSHYYNQHHLKAPSSFSPVFRKSPRLQY